MLAPRFNIRLELPIALIKGVFGPFIAGKSECNAEAMTHPKAVGWGEVVLVARLLDLDLLVADHQISLVAAERNQDHHHDESG